MTSYYIGVDVGTQSVRASLLTPCGAEVATNSVPLHVYNPATDHYEQSCAEIWSAVCAAVQEVTHGIPREQVKGVGFDATCSLVVVDEEGEPLSISRDGDKTCLMWMDHRAAAETAEINTSASPVLAYVGGGFSPEQQPPKLLWLKRHMPATWSAAAHLFDLPDWLTFRATGNTCRSVCSVTCKWGYVRSRGGWDTEFLQEVGLGDLVGLEKLGRTVELPGSRIEGGLNERAAQELGLNPGTCVAVSLIDAHAGALAMLRYSAELCDSLCVISGTSTCIMALCKDKRLVPGVWGPYQDAVLPGTWLFEGGQTAAGSALDHLVQSHPAFTTDMTYTSLNTALAAAHTSLSSPALHRLSQHVHIQPDLHGNRSPLALPWLRGMASGLDLNKDYANLLNLYLATVQGLACGVRHVMERLLEQGLQFSQVVVCGGLADNPLYLHILATVTKLRVVVPRAGNMMCRGAALLAQAAHEDAPLDAVLMRGDTDTDSLVYTPMEDLVQFYEAKYEVYCEMTSDQLKYRKIMQEK